jgi:hypothetical protein
MIVVVVDASVLVGELLRERGPALTAGAACIYLQIIAFWSDGTDVCRRGVSQRLGLCVPVDRDGLTDANDTAELLSLARQSAVSPYQARNSHTRRPTVNLRRRPPMLWLRQRSRGGTKTAAAEGLTCVGCRRSR